MHPHDAAARGLAEGDAVIIHNDQGRVRAPVHLSEDIMPGVVSLLEGMWVALDHDGVDTGGAANMLTSTHGTAPGRACIMHGVAVQVERATG